MSLNSTLTALADAIRRKAKKTGALSLGQMAEEVGGIVTKDDVPKVEIGNITLSKILSSGVVRARVDQSAGLIEEAGSKEVELVLRPLIPGQTITPGTNPIVLEAYSYLLGDQVIEGDPDLKAENIVKGVSIFGVNGNAQTGGGGIDLPELSNPGGSEQLLAGYQMIDQSGNAVDGTIPIRGKDDIETSESESGWDTYAPEGYYPFGYAMGLVRVYASAPAVTVTEYGQIIATASVSKGYCSGGAATATKQLDLQYGQTITPGTETVTIPAQKFLAGAQVIEGDANLKAENIVSGVSIFGVEGSAQTGIDLPALSNPASASELFLGKQLIDGNGNIVNGSFTIDSELSAQSSLIDQIKAALKGKAAGSGGGEDALGALLSNTMTVLDNSVATSLRQRACQQATKLEEVNLPNVGTIGQYAFYNCSGLVTARIPRATSVASQSFYGCSKLQLCDVGLSASIASQAFNACTALNALIIRKADGVCTLSNVNSISNSGIGKGIGYIYVPSALVDSYKAASNWSDYADQIRAIEDYPGIVG